MTQEIAIGEDEPTKPWLEKFKDWVFSGTPEAEAMQTKAFITAVRNLRQQLRKDKRRRVREDDKDLEDLEKYIEEELPGGFLGPIRGVRFVPPELEKKVYGRYGLGHPSIVDQADMELSREIFTRKKQLSLRDTILHEAIHGGHYFPERFIRKVPEKVESLPALPEEIAKLTGFLEKYSVQRMENISEIVKKPYSRISPIERHAEDLSKKILFDTYALTKKHPKKIKKKDFLPYFYKKWQDEILEAPEHISDYGPLSDDMKKVIRDLDIQPLTLKEWKKIFEEVK